MLFHAFLPLFLDYIGIYCIMIMRMLILMYGSLKKIISYIVFVVNTQADVYVTAVVTESVTLPCHVDFTGEVG